MWYKYCFYPQWKRLVYDPAMMYSSTCTMSITTDRAVWFVMWLGGRVGLLETLAGKTLGNITWWINWYGPQREGGREGAKRGLPLMDPNPACINMYYIDRIAIKFHYTSTVLTGQLLKWTTVLQGHWFHLQCGANGAEYHGSVKSISCIQGRFLTIHAGSPPWESHFMNGEDLKPTLKLPDRKHICF